MLSQLTHYNPVFPLELPRYEVAPTIKQMAPSTKHFSLHSDWLEMRKNKEEALNENLIKYVTRSQFSKELEKTAAQKILELLLLESPEFFSMNQARKLDCKISNDCFSWNEKLVVTSSNNDFLVGRPLLDVLLLQVSEDIAIVTKSDDQDYLSYLNICSPSHWAPEDKIGKSFFAVHDVIPNSKKLTQASTRIVDAMINRGPFERSVWSFVTDQRLNHHPAAPVGWNLEKWKGRSFDMNQAEPFTIRVEQQTTLGLPEIESALFTIRIGFIPGSAIKENLIWKSLLISQVESMDDLSKSYKGISKCSQELIDYLQN